MLLWAAENQYSIPALDRTFGRGMIIMHTAFYLYFTKIRFLLMSYTKTKKKTKHTKNPTKNKPIKKNPTKKTKTKAKRRAKKKTKKKTMPQQK